MKGHPGTPTFGHRERRLRRVAATVAAVSLALAATSTVLLGYDAVRGRIALDMAQTLLGVVIFALAFPLVGWVILRRWPPSVAGWVYLAIGFWQALNLFSGQYSNLAFEIASGNLPLAPELSWVAVWAWTPGFTLLCTLGVLLFPDGRLPSPRWWPVVALAMVALALVAVPWALASWPYRGVPLEAAAASDQSNLPFDPTLAVAQTLSLIGQLLLLVAMLGSVAGLVVRFRRSVGVERQQLKWFTFGAAIDLFSLAVWTTGVLDPLTSALSALIFAPALPVAISIAILRHGLYDIDRIISRTVAYTLLTAVLAAVYVVGFVGVQTVLAPFTNGGGPLAVAASTLAAFALFQPVRRRLQVVMDRRFNRGQYDAVREVAGFAARVRNQIEVRQLRGEIVRTLEDTVQPAGVSVWLRGR